MFIGKYYHTMEASGRVSLPKDFRHEQANWVVTRGLDGSLFLFTADSFADEIAKLKARTFTKKINRDFIRLMANEAARLSHDSSGRVQLPKYLIEFAQLKKQLVIVGSVTRIEIWDRNRYHHYLDSIEDKAEEIAEGLTESVDEQ